MQLETGYENRRPRVEIVPLIDIVFLLLVFFVYVMLSMVVYRGVRIQLPSAEGVVEDLKAVIITVTSENAISVDGESMTMQEAVVLAAARAKETGYPVLVSGDRTAALGPAVELLSALRKEDVETVSFQVSAEDPSE
jgi:biopolymer transport protein ExbD